MSLLRSSVSSLRAASISSSFTRQRAGRVFLNIRQMSSGQYEYILTSRPADGVALITLNRPKALNALSTPLFNELNKALADFDEDDSVRAMVLTGSERAFAAGADIKEMKDKECKCYVCSSACS